MQSAVIKRNGHQRTPKQSALYVYVYYFTIYGVNCINSAAIQCMHGSTSQEVTGEEETTFCNITTPPHYCNSQELSLLTFDFKGEWLLGNVDIKVCVSPGGFTALIKVALRHISLAVSTCFAGPVKLRCHGVTRGDNGSEERQ